MKSKNRTEGAYQDPLKRDLCAEPLALNEYEESRFALEQLKYKNYLRREIDC